jgi:hypothetical protein
MAEYRPGFKTAVIIFYGEYWPRRQSPTHQQRAAKVLVTPRRP